MRKHGFIVCGGNLFYHDSAQVLAEIVYWTDGGSLCVFCNNAKEFALLHKKMVSLFENQFEIRAKAFLRQGLNYFELYFYIYGDAERRFAEIDLVITEYKSVSNFVQCD